MMASAMEARNTLGMTATREMVTSLRVWRVEESRTDGHHCCHHRISLLQEDNILENRRASKMASKMASRQYVEALRDGLGPCSVSRLMWMTTGGVAKVYRSCSSHSNKDTIPGLGLAWRQSDNSIGQLMEAECAHWTWLYRCCCSHYHCHDSWRGGGSCRGPTGNVMDGRRVLMDCIHCGYTCEDASCRSCPAVHQNWANGDQEHARAPSHNQSWSAVWHGPNLVRSQSPWLGDTPPNQRSRPNPAHGPFACACPQPERAKWAQGWHGSPSPQAPKETWVYPLCFDCYQR